MVDEDGNKFLKPLMKKAEYWLSSPSGSEVWEHVHLFQGEWLPVYKRLEWYDSPNVPDIYEQHKYIMRNIDMARPEETYYEENLDSGVFASEMYTDTGLPSGKGNCRIDIDITARSPPSGENNFGSVEYSIDTKIKYKGIPSGVTFLPRIIANPLNQFFKWAFLNFYAEEMVGRDGEFAREKTTEYLQYLRKYHGEEPTQTKTKQSQFKPVPEEGIFFQ